jgi:hypothetical protein
MLERMQSYVAQYLNLSRLGQWCQSDMVHPRYKFKARNDEEALDIALSFAQTPAILAEGCKRKRVIEQKYELSNLYRIEEVRLTRKAPKRKLRPCVGRDGFQIFV